MIRELIKETLELFCWERRLKRIDKAMNKYNRINEKAKRQAHTVHVLVGKYNEIYKHDPIRIKGGPESHD